MRYAKNEATGGLVNGVIFEFESGDEEIAADVLELVKASEKPPTRIAWNCECPTPLDALHRLETLGLAEGEWLRLRFTINDLPLLKKVLELFKEDYPALSQMVAEIEGDLFGTKH